MLITIIVLLLLLLLSALFSGLETAFYSVSQLTARSLAKSKTAGAEALLEVKQQQRRMIITILIGNNTVNIGASAIATSLAIDTFGSTGVGIATGIMTFLVLLFGEIFPKNLASIYSLPIALRAAQPLLMLMLLLAPLSYLFELMIKGFHVVFPRGKPENIFSEEKLKTLVEIGTEEKALGHIEKELIEGVLQFDDITAHEVMTPRSKVFALDQTTVIREALSIINRKSHSRVPLYAGVPDRIIGFVHIRDILKAVEKNNLDTTLRSIMHKPLFVPHRKPINQLFKELQAKKRHMAIVVDEHHHMDGIVTIEDLIEEVVGEIMDEDDLSPEAIMRVDKNTIIVHGDTEIGYVNDFLNVKLPYHRKKIKELLKQKGQALYNGVTLTVTSRIGGKILKVKVSKEAQY